MSELVSFYYNPMSRGRIVHWMLEEIGAQYEFKILDWAKKEHKSPEFLQINPMGKIPTIVHRGTVVTETAAICLYLADAFPQAGMAPAAHDPLRGSYYRWLFFTINCFEQAVTDKNLPRITQVPSTQLGYGTFEETMRVLHQAVSQGYVLRDKFSTVDLYLSSVLGWFLEQKLLEPTPELLKYQQRCCERPSHKRFMEQVQKLMGQ